MDSNSRGLILERETPLKAFPGSPHIVVSPTVSFSVYRGSSLCPELILSFFCLGPRPTC